MLWKTTESATVLVLITFPHGGARTGLVPLRGVRPALEIRKQSSRSRLLIFGD